MATATAENPLLEGLSLRRRPDPCVLVIFGASGDLTARKLMPALYSLAYRRLLPEKFAVVGAARTEETDDLLIVLKGRLTVQLRDGDVDVGPGELLVVPRGVEHCPKAEHEVSLMLFEPAGTLNTGDAGGAMTVAEPERI